MSEKHYIYKTKIISLVTPPYQETTVRRENRTQGKGAGDGMGMQQPLKAWKVYKERDVFVIHIIHSHIHCNLYYQAKSRFTDILICLLLLLCFPLVFRGWQQIATRKKNSIFQATDSQLGFSECISGVLWRIVK